MKEVKDMKDAAERHETKMLSADEIEKISGVGDFAEKIEVMGRYEHPKHERTILFKGEKAFCVLNPTTIEVRTDAKLSQVLQKKYESVMESRYFGKGGIEIVQTGQLSDAEMADLIRLSYGLT